MAINFPDSPSNLQEFTSGGRTFVYDSVKNKWTLTGNNSFLTVDTLQISGDLIWNPTTKSLSFSEKYSTDGELLSGILRVDGAGTGVDADKLDGQHGHYYLNYINFTNKPLIVQANTENTLYKNNTFVQNVTINGNTFLQQTSISGPLTTSGITASGLTVTGSGTVQGNLTVDGDALFSGNTTIVNKTTISTTDALLQFASNNEFSDITDIGFFAHFNNGSGNNHTGFFRDSGTKEYYTFGQYQPGAEPESNIDITHATFSLANTHVAHQKSANTVTFLAEYDNGNSSTAQTINWNNGQKQKTTLTGACTITFTAPAGAGNFLLKVVQDATGSRTVTWPASVKWPAGTAPTLTTAASSVDIVTFYYDGANYYAQAGLAFS